MARIFKRSPLAMAVLALLYEAPMHPYRMQQLIKERGKDRVINVERRASLYQIINQLERAGLIAVREITRDEKRPERTIYELTDKGLQTALDWLRAALSTPTDEFPEFPAAVSFLSMLSPVDVQRQLERRAAALAARLDEIDTGLQKWLKVLPRLFLLEEELVRVTLDAELQWVRALIDDLRTGAIAWSEEWLRKLALPESDADSE